MRVWRHPEVGQGACRKTNAYRHNTNYQKRISEEKEDKRSLDGGSRENSKEKKEKAREYAKRRESEKHERGTESEREKKRGKQ